MQSLLHAIVAQLVERWLPKPKVAGSCPVYRSWKGFQTWSLFSFYRLGKPKACPMARYPLARAEGRGIVPRLSLKMIQLGSVPNCIILCGLVLWAEQVVDGLDGIEG